MALVSSHTPEPVLPIENYRTGYVTGASRHGGVPILDRSCQFPVNSEGSMIVVLHLSPVDIDHQERSVLEGVSYATSDESKAEVLVGYDADQVMLLGVTDGAYSDEVFILTNTEHYLRELGYMPESEHDMVDQSGRKWSKR